MSALKSFLYRVAVALLFLAVPVFGTWTIVKAEDWGVGFPPMYSTYGGQIDNLFWVIFWMVMVTFLLTELALVWFVFKYSKKNDARAEYSHGNHTLEVVWTAIPALLFVFIAFSQMGAWSNVKMNFPDEGPYTVETPLMEVYASQFDWRARYPDEEGNFRGVDAVESPFDIYVPVNTEVVFHLYSRDVLHSFFVPVFRLKQDAVPGMRIPVWFEATEVGSFDLICAELCGWGHYKMAGKIHVLPQDEFDQWLADKRAALYSRN